MSAKVDKKYLDLLEIMEDLNKPRGDGLEVGMDVRLHDKQIECLGSIFGEQKSIIFVPCGRKFGKTELAQYALWRWALTNPGSNCYYVAPEKSHGKELIWKTNRLQKFLEGDSSKYIAKIRDREMTIIFKNGSQISIIGSENWAAANGMTPDFVVYDEFKVFHPQFHIEMDPNRAAKGASLLVIGTQPKVGDRNKEQYEQVMKYCKEHQEENRVHVYTTFDNPINHLPKQKKIIAANIAQLRASDQEDVVQREYYSKIVSGGSRAIFPMFKEEHVVVPHHELVRTLEKDVSSLEWILTCDPGNTTCFAVLLMAINPRTKQIYLVDEIYETKQEFTVASNIWPRAEDMIRKIHPTVSIYDDVRKVADEAGAWFITDVLYQFRVTIHPTQKHINKKESGLSIIKDAMIHGLLTISDKCENTIKEIAEYAIDRNGRIPKERDHAIDAIRYGLHIAHYNIIEAIRTKRKINHPIYNGIVEEIEEEQEYFPVNAELDFDFFD